MICPKCGYDAGEAKFCPECGEKMLLLSTEENQTISVQDNKKSKKKIIVVISVAVAIIGLFVALFGSIASRGKYVEWSTIKADYIDNGVIAKEKYKNILFYVRIDSVLASYGSYAEVSFFEDSTWNEKCSFKGRVHFKDVSKLHSGHCYVIKGGLSNLDLTKFDEINFVYIKNAKVISYRE